MSIAGLKAAVAEIEGLEADRDTKAATIARRDETIAARDATIAGLNETVALNAKDALNKLAQIAALNSEIDRLTAEMEALRPRPKFILGDGTRKQFLGDGGFTEPFPFCYQSELYPSGAAASGPISQAFVLGTTMPRWRARYPDSPRWSADLEWQNSDNAITAAEVQALLPAYQGAREFLGASIKMGSYGFPPRFGIGRDPAKIRAQIEVCRPILDLLDEAHITLYPIYLDIEDSRQYFRENIAMAREAMPDKRVFVLLWPAWHNNVNPNGADPALPKPGTPVSVEWWRMALDTAHELADGAVIWLKAAAPKPTNEPWWLETLRWRAEKGL